MDRSEQDREFNDFVTARSRALLGTAYLLAGDRGRAEDLVQTALLKTYLRWARLRDPRAIEAYVRRTMVTTAISWSRRRWRGEIATGAMPEPPSADPTALVDGRAALWPHLVALPARQRAVLVLRYYEDLTETQVAEQLGCSVGTVKSQAHRGLATLRSRIGLELDSDGATLDGTPHDEEITPGGGR